MPRCDNNLVWSLRWRWWWWWWVYDHVIFVFKSIHIFLYEYKHANYGHYLAKYEDESHIQYTFNVNIWWEKMQRTTDPTSIVWNRNGASAEGRRFVTRGSMFVFSMFLTYFPINGHICLIIYCLQIQINWYKLYGVKSVQTNILVKLNPTGFILYTSKISLSTTVLNHVILRHNILTQRINSISIS